MDVESVDDENDCPICRDGIDGQTQATMATCRHKFHADCIRMVLIDTSSCPMCRTANRSIMVEGPAEPHHEETFFDIIPIMREKCFRCLGQDAGERFQCFGCAFEFHTACETSRLVLNRDVSYCSRCKDDRDSVKKAILERLNEERNLVLNAVRELDVEERDAFDRKVFAILKVFIQLGFLKLFDRENESDE